MDKVKNKIQIYMYTGAFIMVVAIILAQKFLPEKEDDGYRLVWSEEFDYEGPPDPAIWTHEHGFVRNHELQWYQPENARVADGVLTIYGRLDSFPNPNFQERSRDWKHNRRYVEYTSSCIKTIGTKEFTYGRFEIRARIPTASGSWPAIWTMGTTMNWPSCGEIDIMEYYLIDDVPHILANTAWGSDHAWQPVWNTGTTPLSVFTDEDPDWVNKFHVWKMDWNEEAIRIYLNDRLMNETLLSETYSGADGKFTNPFHKPHYILLNLAIGGQHGGTPDHDAFPLKYEIDYIRVYQKKR